MARRVYTVLIASGVLLLVSPLMLSRLHPNKYVSPRRVNLGALSEQNSGAIGHILGAVRTSISDMMFMKTEIYLHSGIRYAPHLDVGAMESEGTTGETHDPANPDSVPVGFVGGTEAEVAGHNIRPGQVKVEEEEGPPPPTGEPAVPEAATMIPTQEEDFRGFIGALEREVKPWQDPSLPHKNTSGDELLPWYRIMTLADPQNVRGYAIGTWWLLQRDDDKSNREAMKFIDEGVENNPDAFQLWLMKGRVHDRLDQPDQAIEAWTKARKLAFQVRPQNGTESDMWSDYLEDDARAAATFEAFHLAKSGRLEEARKAAEETLKAIPDFDPMHHLIEQIGAGEYDKYKK